MNLTINTGTLTKAHSTDAGFDIHASESAEIPPNTPTPVSTNLTITLPLNSVAFIKPRSGLAFKNGINTLAGVIDQDYSGEVKILLINHSSTTFNISKGDRIAQLVILPLPTISVTTLSTATYNNPDNDNDNNNTTTRGTNGFGSTGV